MNKNGFYGCEAYEMFRDSDVLEWVQEDSTKRLFESALRGIAESAVEAMVQNINAIAISATGDDAMVALEICLPTGHTLSVSVDADDLMLAARMAQEVTKSRRDSDSFSEKIHVYKDYSAVHCP